MIRLGILDFDTSHCVEFTKRLNHKEIAEDQCVDGARVVVGCPGSSRIAPELIPKYQKEMEKLGVPLVRSPTEMIGKVDGVLVESQEGGVHWERARPFLEAGLPCFIDKPFACRVDDAHRIVELAQRKKIPIFSSSSLRFAPDVVQFLVKANYGKILGAFCYGPARVHERNPGLYHYGIHPVEMLFTIMGPGCVRVAATHEKDVDLVTGQWEDGRVASVRGIRSGNSAYGFVVFTDRGGHSITVDTRYIYRELLRKVVEMFSTGKSPLDIVVTVEVIAFIEAALASANNHGVPQRLETARMRNRSGQ
jgi:predicted dehydrogenase